MRFRLHLGWLAPVSMALAFGLLGHARAQEEQECRTDADCPEGVPCEKSSGQRDCAPGDSTCDGGFFEEEIGECEPAPVDCETSADCPAGLTCVRDEQQRGCTPAAGDGEPSPECEPPTQTESGRCGWDPPACEDDSECNESEACTAQVGVRECSGSAPACAPGAECPQPQEPVCTETETRNCFPKPVACASDGDCAADARCVALNEDAQAHPPEGWEGLTDVCLPEGLALAVEGKIALVGGSSSSEDSDSRPRGGMLAEDLGNDSGEEDDGNCALRAPGANHSVAGVQAGLLLLFEIALVRARRSR